MAFWDDMQKLVNDLNRDFGRQIRLQKVVEKPTFDPVTGETSGEITSDQTGIASFPPSVSGLGGPMDSYITNSLVQESDIVAILSTNGINNAPQTHDRIIDGSNRYDITRVITIHPGTKLVCWYLGLKA